MFTAYPTHLLDWKTKQTLTSSYFFWIPAWIEHAIDWERSEETLNLETGVRYLTKLVVTTECETKAPLLFQAKERASILVYNRLRQQLEATGMRGINFAPLDAAYAPSQGPRKARLDHALQVNPSDWETWCELGNVLTALCRYQDALNAFDQVLVFKGDSREAWYGRGRVLRLLGYNEEALKAFAMVLEGEPQPKAWQGYCEVLREVGRYEEALLSAR